MEINSRPVVVKRMPERVNGRTAREFLRDVRPFLSADRPQLVFDLSQVVQLDAAGVEMLLRCMSEAHKRDGDLKAGLPFARSIRRAGTYPYRAPVRDLRNLHRRCTQFQRLSSQRDAAAAIAQTPVRSGGGINPRTPLDVAIR